MKVWNIKREWKRPIFVHCRKHRCPVCGGMLEPVKVSQIVRRGAAEAKDHDFSFPGGDGEMIGDIRFIRTEFHCAACGQNHSINKIYELEKKGRRLP